MAEALSLLSSLGAEPSKGGPLSEAGGVFWITLPAASVDAARELFPRLGYSSDVDLVTPRDVSPAGARTVRWKGEMWQLVRLYEEAEAELRERAPDRRTFLLESQGEVRPVRGYRGSSDRLARRGLPVADARLLVNLVHRSEPGVLLDPFAGAGGVVIEAVDSGWRVVSADVDPRLRHGLAELASQHFVADARHLPLAAAAVQAVATEPPYDPGATEVVAEAVAEMRRVLVPGGKVSMLVSSAQAERLRAAAAGVGFTPTLDTSVDRKGVATVILCWDG